MNLMNGTHDTWEDEQPDAEEHESVPEDLESAADQVEEAFATWQESRRLMNEMAKARGFYPVTNKLEYMQALAWVSRDGIGPQRQKQKQGWLANLAVTARRLRRHDGEKELESRTLEQTVVQRPHPLPRLHRTLPHTELLLNMALVSNVQDSEHRMR